jgi:Domain of unknown function (DUF4124)
MSNSNTQDVRVRVIRIATCMAISTCAGHTAFAQKPVYRCTDTGGVSYSDAPCVGATRSFPKPFGVPSAKEHNNSLV